MLMSDLKIAEKEDITYLETALGAIIALENGKCPTSEPEPPFHDGKKESNADD